MKRIGEWKLFVLLLCLPAVLLSACHVSTVDPPETKESGKEESRQGEEEQEEGNGEESDPAQEDMAANAAGSRETQADRLAGGGTGELTYEVSSLDRQYTAEDGTVIFQAKISYPSFSGPAEGTEAINLFFRNWVAAKIREYEEGEDSLWHSALEVYRESRDSGWMGPWSEEYRVSSVRVQGGYLSVLLDSYLEEGGAHGMPCREGYVFRVRDGQPVDLTEMSEMTRVEWDKLLRARFADLIDKEDASLFYEDASERIKTYDMGRADYYFAADGIVFYLAPYEIAPYATGYVEILIPYEEACLKEE